MPDWLVTTNRRKPCCRNSLQASRDVLEDIAQGRGPAKRLFFLGYAGWEPGQLEAELVAGDWITVGADPAVIFDVPPQQRYEAALKLLGLDMQALQFSSGKAGHA